MLRCFLFFFVSLFIIAFFLGRCKSVQPFVLPTSGTLPKAFADFTHRKDTFLLDSLPVYKVFFKDTLLVNLVEQALKKNFDMKVALFNIQQYQAAYDKARGVRIPFASPSFTMGFYKQGLYTIDGVEQLSDEPKSRKTPYPIQPHFSIGFNTSWEADIWHKLKDNMRARSIETVAAKERLRFLSTMVTAEVAMRYYELIALDYTLEVLAENIAFQEKSVEVVRLQKHNGYATSLAEQQVEAQLLYSQSTYKDVEQRIVEVESALNTLLGQPFSVITRDKTTFQDEDISILNRLSVSTKILLNRPDIQAAERILQAARLDVEVARKSFFPSLNLGGFLGLTSFSIQQWFNVASITSNLLAGLTAPLLNRSQIKAQFKGAKASAMKAFYEYEKIVVNGYNEVQQNILSINKLVERYDFQKRRTSLLFDAKKTATDLYMSNYANYLEIITAQQSYLQAFMNLVEVKQRIFFLYIDLYRSLGGGWK